MAAPAGVRRAGYDQGMFGNRPGGAAEALERAAQQIAPGKGFDYGKDPNKNPLDQGRAALGGASPSAGGPAAAQALGQLRGAFGNQQSFNPVQGGPQPFAYNRQPEQRTNSVPFQGNALTLNNPLASQVFGYNRTPETRGAQPQGQSIGLGGAQAPQTFQYPGAAPQAPAAPGAQFGGAQGMAGGGPFNLYDRRRQF